MKGILIQKLFLIQHDDEEETIMTKRMISLLLAAMLTLAILIPAACAEEIQEEKDYYVYTENGRPLNVRREPGGDVIGSLDFGTKVRVVSFLNEDWAAILYQDRTAYVNARFLIDVEPDILKKVMEEEVETITGDPITDINAEFKSAQTVQPYKVKMRPARVTSWVNMRWIPSETGMIISQYKAGEELTVLKELDHYLQVQDPDTGDVGYIHKKFAAR